MTAGIAEGQVATIEPTEFDLALLCEIEQFLFMEAELLDDRRFDEWLDLLTDDIRYWMPMQRNVLHSEQTGRAFTREQQDIAWFDEGKETLVQRVRQIQTGIHWAEEPLSRTTHMLSNIRVLGGSESEAQVRSAFLVYRSRLEDETDFFVGKRKDRLRKVDGMWKVARREIILDQNVLLAKNLTIFF